MKHTTAQWAIALCITLPAIAMTMPQAWSQDPPMAAFRHGYLFVDGEYVQPPYNIQTTENAVIINEKKFAKGYFDLAGFESREASDGGRMGRRMGMMERGRQFQGRRGFGRFSPLARISEGIAEAQLGAIVVLYENEDPLVLYASSGGHQLIGELAGISNTEFSDESTVGSDPQNPVVWNRLVSEFRPTDRFVERVAADLKAVEEAEVAGRRTSASNQLVAQISYPLTVFAMIVVVLGFGHLLSNRPVQDPESGDTTKARTVLVKSLLIIALLSIVDLIWTIAATNAGTMRELNPLGSHLIDDPMRLTLFKLSVSAISIGILYALHRTTMAQLASWWCCLLLTLLTARWVVFQSMLA